MVQEGKKIDRTAYQRAYYLKNKEEKLKKSKERWLSDAAYREREIARSKIKREAIKAERLKLERTKWLEKIQQVPVEPAIISLSTGSRLPRTVPDVGIVYSLPVTASYCEVRPDVVLKWLREGYIPGASVWMGGRAWFTEGYMRVVRLTRFTMLAEGRLRRAQFCSKVKSALREVRESFVSGPR